VFGAVASVGEFFDVVWIGYGYDVVFEYSRYCWGLWWFGGFGCGLVLCQVCDLIGTRYVRLFLCGLDLSLLELVGLSGWERCTLGAENFF
jgi:hypothetical protein